MSYLPCLNQSCKSYGKPHPNCQCHPEEMAKGGDVSHFCGETRGHKKECQYYAEGGEALADQASPAPLTETEFNTPTDTLTSTEEDPPPSWEETSPIKEEEPTWENTTPAEEEEEPTWENTKGKYDSLPQQIGAGLEGFAQGFAGPLATLAETGLSKLGVPGLTPEDIRGRKEAHPATHTAAEVAGTGTGLYTGLGEAALLSKAATRILPESMPILGRIGATALKGFLTNASIGAGDELSKAMIGDGDPEHPVASALANIGFTGLMGGLFEGAGGALAATNSKLGSKAASLMAGLGSKAEGTPEQGLRLIDKDLFDQKWFDRGEQLYQKLLNTATSSAAGAATTGTIVKSGGLAIPAAGFLHKTFENLFQKPVAGAGRLLIPVTTKAFNEGMGSNLLPLLNYASQVERGNKLLNSSVDALFKQGYKKISNPISKTLLDDADSYLDEGGADQDIQQEIYNRSEAEAKGYAKGGEVEDNKPETPSAIHDHPIANVYPEQNMMLQMAKGRISNYLKALKPDKYGQKLAFDMPPDQTEKKKNYTKALKIAVNPLSIMDEVQNGTLLPDHLKHFNAMYPELGNVLQKKITDKITKSQMEGKKPSFKVRQGLSMMMGTPLSSDLTPQTIQAIQSIYQTPQNAGQTQSGLPLGGAAGGAPKAKRSYSSLSKSSQSFLTGNQSLTRRSQKQ